jgi:hypothetical protein
MYIVDMFEEIVSRVRASYDEENNLEPYYDYGHIQGILSKLTAKDSNDVLKFQKYPLICLILDQKEIRGKDIRYDLAFAPRILIVTDTQQDYTEQDRTENSFKPVLWPIYDLLVQEIKDYEHFGFANRKLYDHDKYDRYYWGQSEIFGNQGVIFNDYLDGIEIISRDINVLKSPTKC